MKKIIALLLLLAVSAQTFSQGILLLNFYINQSYVAANQCENRYRPMLHCNGKCVLAKKLKQQEKSEGQNPERKLQNKYEVASSCSFFAINIIMLQPFYPIHQVLSPAATIDQPSFVFHPPCR